MEQSRIALSTKLLAITLLFCSVFGSSVFAQQTANTMEQTVTQTMQYLLYLPTDYETSSDKTFPLMLFLHGGDGGDDVEAVKTHGPPKLVEQGRNFPFIIVAPLNPFEDQLFPIETVATLLDDVIANHRVDENRVYLTGLSRGAFSAWQMVGQYPDTFAAVAPIAGGGVPNYVPENEVPFWVFHSAKDEVISLSAAVEMVEKLLEDNAEEELEREVKLTVYPEASHQETWETAYANPELYSWMLQQSR